MNAIIKGMNAVIKWLKRNPCKECIYYHPTNNTCNSKKCAYANPYVNIMDRLLCHPCKSESEDKTK